MVGWIADTARRYLRCQPVRSKSHLGVVAQSISTRSAGEGCGLLKDPRARELSRKQFSYLYLVAAAGTQKTPGTGPRMALIRPTLCRGGVTRPMAGDSLLRKSITKISNASKLAFLQARRGKERRLIPVAERCYAIRCNLGRKCCVDARLKCLRSLVGGRRDR